MTSTSKSRPAPPSHGTAAPSSQPAYLRGLLKDAIAVLRDDPELREELSHVLSAADRTPARYLSPRAFAEQHSLGVSTVRELIRDGRLPAIRIGRCVRIAADAQIAPVAATKHIETTDSRADRRLGLVRGGQP